MFGAPAINDLEIHLPIAVRQGASTVLVRFLVSHLDELHDVNYRPRIGDIRPFCSRKLPGQTSFGGSSPGELGWPYDW